MIIILRFLLLLAILGSIAFIVISMSKKPRGGAAWKVDLYLDTSDIYNKNDWSKMEVIFPDGGEIKLKPLKKINNERIGTITINRDISIKTQASFFRNRHQRKNGLAKKEALFCNLSAEEFIKDNRALKSITLVFWGAGTPRCDIQTEYYPAEK